MVMAFLLLYVLLIGGLGYLARNWQFVRVDGVPMSETWRAGERWAWFVIGHTCGLILMSAFLVYCALGGRL